MTLRGDELDVLNETPTGELLEELDAVLLEFRRRLDRFVALGDDEIVAADQGFAIAGLVAAAAGEAARHAEAVRDALLAKIEAA